MLRTTHQRRVLCESCPVARVADILGDSVSLLIVRDLLERPRRFTSMELALAGVSARTLTKKLRSLEHEGIISRHPNFKLGTRVDYRITKKGAALKRVVDAMRSYGKKYL